MTDVSPLTSALRGGIDTDTAHGAVVPPIYLSSSFAFEGLGQGRAYDYTRSGNPTRDIAGEAVSTLEGGAGGTVVATGMGATTLVLLSLLRPGDVIAAPHDSYGGTWRLFDQFAAKGQYRIETVDFTDAESAAATLRRVRPKLVWLESPSNPLLRITDLEAVSAVAHEVGATVAVDNTFLTPLVQRPFELGADVVVHSATKYLNGHSDIVSGVVVAKTPQLHEQFQYWANVLGIGGSPFDAYLLQRGIRTLELRVARHQENALAIVDAIADHEAIASINFPGLPTHAGHEIAKRQQRGFGAMLSLELRGGRDAAARFLDGLRLFSLAVSLGGVESLVAHPETMTHASMTAEAREKAGVTGGLLRFSIGIEPVVDLIADLREALDRAK